ncbi:LYR motif-containing protein 2 [Copidosoma floridanum]|uniref:LYR motif-containing protein 2 n=1 Tax=Copidosoma floridanum TaxID=29053 RepID=UPI0006C9D121|nr:LYR motif-containing protein 2 [Copidosoma floridanum]
MKPGPPPMSLKQFMNSRQVLKLYKKILKTIKLIPDEADQEYMRNWARSDFRTYKNVTDDLQLKALLDHGEKSLRELQKNLGRSQ